MITRPQAKTQDESKHAGQAEVGNHRTGILGGTQEENLVFHTPNKHLLEAHFSSIFPTFSVLLSLFYFNSCVRQPEK